MTVYPINEKSKEATDILEIDIMSNNDFFFFEVLQNGGRRHCQKRIVPCVDKDWQTEACHFYTEEVTI